MTTWVLGDIHGCADELERLIGDLELGSQDRVVACGDLFHRGPDPVGVLEALQRVDARFILGNHERAVLKRWGLAPEDGPAPPLRRAVEPEDLAGDGGRPLNVRRADAPRLLDFLRGHSGYLLVGDSRAAHGGRWVCVHAGLHPRRPLADQSVQDCVSMRRVPLPGRPYWYELWEGPELVLFGHIHGRLPRVRRIGARPVALGLDTGCVYGGALTAYSPELDEFRHVRARKTYAASR